MSIRSRKKVLFFSILFAILLFMNFLLDPERLNPHYPLQYSEVFHPKVNADVIIMGPSQTAHGINPKYLETEHLKVFNFSMNGASPSFNLKWYKKVFQPRYPKPSLVVYGVHWGMFDENFLQRRLEQDSKYFPKGFLIQEFLDTKSLNDLGRIKTLFLNRLGIIRGRSQLAERLFKGTSNIYVLSKYYNGFIPYERKGRVDRKRDIKLKNSEAQITAFEDLLDEFEKNRIEVIFVQVPEYLPVRDASDIQENMQLLNRIAEKRNIPFLDYDTKRITSINTDASMFSDSIHLNEKGSDVFSKLLKDDLEFLLKRKTLYGGGHSI
jgi:lysophospholipase L1-like esterase